MWVNRILMGLLIVAIGLLSVVFYRQLTSLKDTQHENNTQNILTNQFLLSTINWSTQRQKTILFMRDKIIKEWERIGVDPNYDRAYQKAEAIMKECERYPNIKPMILLAVNRRESSHLDSTKDSSGARIVMTSPAGARGSWQFVPSTARLLCDALGISYSERVYTDVAISTRMAAKYFDVLWAAYGNDTMSVADYNGGPMQAHYYMRDRTKLSDETRGFVPDVLKFADSFQQEFATYKVEKAVAR